MNGLTLIDRLLDCGKYNPFQLCSEAADALEISQAEIAGLKTYAATLAAERDALAKELADIKSSMAYRTSYLGRLEAELAAIKAQSEPVAEVIYHDGCSNTKWLKHLTNGKHNLYTHPAQADKDGDIVEACKRLIGSLSVMVTDPDSRDDILFARRAIAAIAKEGKP